MKLHISLAFISFSVSPFFHCFLQILIVQWAAPCTRRCCTFTASVCPCVGTSSLCWHRTPTTEQLIWRNTATRPKRTRRSSTACTESAAARVSRKEEQSNKSQSTQWLVFVLDVLECGASIIAALCPFQFQNKDSFSAFCQVVLLSD